MTIYLQGDLHGDKNNIKDCLAQIENPKEEDIIIVCGDASLEYGKYNMGNCKKLMSKFPGTWLILRGNHDCRYTRKHSIHAMDGLVPAVGWDFSDRFDEATIFEKKYPNIHYIDDIGGIYNVDSHSILFVPGAYSVDRAYRLANNYPYEFEEVMTLDEFQYTHKSVLKYKDDIEFLISHTYPETIEDKLKHLFMSSVEQSTVDKTTEHWIALYEFECPNLKHTFFGHMHQDIEIDAKHTLLYKKVIRLEDYV